jgi:hypothetical protein
MFGEYKGEVQGVGVGVFCGFLGFVSLVFRLLQGRISAVEIISFSTMLSNTVFALAALAGGAAAHYKLLEPTWRGDSFEEPASQWIFPCKYPTIIPT